MPKTIRKPDFQQTKGEKHMRGTGVGNVVAQNMAASSAKRSHEKWMRSQFMMCWICQKDKSPIGGYLRFAAGLHKFICKDCMDAKEKANGEAK
jgi:hypothetical protein